MNWQDIKISTDNTHFLFANKPIFAKQFLEVLKFHAPGLAPVKDESGAYHIDSKGEPLYVDRFDRTFGYYCNKATVIQEKNWFHLTDKGQRAYLHSFSWAGNYQENLCAVRDNDNNYFHIDLQGNRVYNENHVYAGDFKDGIACVKTASGFYKHINTNGAFLNDKSFLDLGIFHKNFATAKDKLGWHHIDRFGDELYPQRYVAIEPFYNGFALVTQLNDNKLIIDEKGNEILII